MIQFNGLIIVEAVKYDDNQATYVRVPLLCSRFLP